jgi:hypothetical protein
MKRHTPHDDPAILRSATRTLCEVAAAVGGPGRRPRPAKAGEAPIDRRRLAAMRAEVEVQQRALRERRDQIGVELDAASRRVAAMVAYAKCDTLARPRASRGQTDGARR